jgi:hypothetical protein
VLPAIAGLAVVLGVYLSSDPEPAPLGRRAHRKLARPITFESRKALISRVHERLHGLMHGRS